MSNQMESSFYAIQIPCSESTKLVNFFNTVPYRITIIESKETQVKNGIQRPGAHDWRG